MEIHVKRVKIEDIYFLPQKEKMGGIDVVWNELTNVETNWPGSGMNLL